MSFTCCGCFEENLNEAIMGHCNNSHIICKNCIQSGIEKSVNKMLNFKCPVSGCTQPLTENTIHKCVTDATLHCAYFKIRRHNALRNIVGLKSCKNCVFATFIKETEVKFYCHICKKFYCVSCKQDVHEGVCLTDEIASS